MTQGIVFVQRPYPFDFFGPYTLEHFIYSLGRSEDRILSIFTLSEGPVVKRYKRPNKQLPFDLKQFQAKIPDLGRSVCAIIEFESAQAAKFAVETLKFRTQELKFRLALLEPGVSNYFFV